MDLKVDLRQSGRSTVRSLEPSRLTARGLAADDDRTLIGRGSGPYSYWSDCECPDDCLRDHENE
jgi:hypothetical protein